MFIQYLLQSLKGRIKIGKEISLGGELLKQR